MKHNTINLVKFKTLAKLINKPMYQTVGVLETLWIFTITNARDGDLSKFSALEIAAWIDYDGDHTELIEALIQCRWLDRHEDGSLRVHDWQEHAPNWLLGVLSREQPSPEQSGPPSPRPSPAPSSGPSSAPSLAPGGVPSQPNLTQPNQTKPPPPPPTPSRPEGGGGGSLDSWEAIGDQLASLGMADVTTALQAAQRRGMTVPEVAALAEHFRAANGKWKIGALHWRIATGQAGRPPSEGWPAPDDTVTRRNARRKADKQSAAERAAYRIIKAGKKAKRSEAEIRAELQAAGLSWP